MKGEIKVEIAVYPEAQTAWVGQNFSAQVREPFGDEKVFGVFTITFDLPAEVEAAIQENIAAAERKILEGQVSDADAVDALAEGGADDGGQ